MNANARSCRRVVERVAGVAPASADWILRPYSWTKPAMGVEETTPVNRTPNDGNEKGRRRFRERPSARRETREIRLRIALPVEPGIAHPAREIRDGAIESAAIGRPAAIAGTVTARTGRRIGRRAGDARGVFEAGDVDVAQHGSTYEIDCLLLDGRLVKTKVLSARIFSSPWRRDPRM